MVGPVGLEPTHGPVLRESKCRDPRVYAVLGVVHQHWPTFTYVQMLSKCCHRSDARVSLGLHVDGSGAQGLDCADRRFGAGEREVVALLQSEPEMRCGAEECA